MTKKLVNIYNKIALEYFIENGINEHLAIPALKKFSKLLPLKSQILDVGCGGGQDANFLVEQGHKVLGIDLSKEMIKIARHFYPNIPFKTLDIMKLPTTKKFNGIWCCRVFQHIAIKDQDKFLDKINSLLKRGGILYLTSALSHENHDFEKNDLNLVESQTTGSLLKKRLTAKSFKSLIESHGLKIIKFQHWKNKTGMDVLAQK